MKYDVVGSFLLPERLMDARNQYGMGVIDYHHLHMIEDDAIRLLVEHQLASGLEEVTSGEYRRNHWDKDFWFGLGGIRCRSPTCCASQAE